MRFLEFLKEIWGGRKERKEGISEEEGFKQETEKRYAQVKVRLARIGEFERARKQSLDSIDQK